MQFNESKRQQKQSDTLSWHWGKDAEEKKLLTSSKISFYTSEQKNYWHFLQKHVHFLIFNEMKWMSSGMQLQWMMTMTQKINQRNMNIEIFFMFFSDLPKKNPP